MCLVVANDMTAGCHEELPVLLSRFSVKRVGAEGSALLEAAHRGSADRSKAPRRIDLFSEESSYVGSSPYVTVNILEERAGIIILPPVTHRTLARRRGLSRGLAILCRMRLSLWKAFAAHVDVFRLGKEVSLERSAARLDRYAD